MIYDISYKERLKKETVVHWFQILAENFPESLEEDHDQPQSE
jgi:hypothetical protein